MYCRHGLRSDERGGWSPDPERCTELLRRGDVAAHEAVCLHVIEACPFAGCGVLRLRRDAGTHDAEAAAAHASGERAARLALEAQLRVEVAARNKNYDDACRQLEAARREASTTIARLRRELDAARRELQASSAPGSALPALGAAAMQPALPPPHTDLMAAPRAAAAFFYALLQEQEEAEEAAAAAAVAANECSRRRRR